MPSLGRASVGHYRLASPRCGENTPCVTLEELAAITSGECIGTEICPRDRVHSPLCCSRPAAPVVDAVVVGLEPVVEAPEDGVRSPGHADLAVRGADVGLDGVDAEVITWAISLLDLP